MIVLTEEQIGQIVKQLEKGGLNYAPIKEELLDHVCCQVEHKLELGLSFEQALTQAFNAFKEDEFKNIQQEIIKPKSSIMQKLVRFAPLFIMGLAVIYFFYPSSESPIKEVVEPLAPIKNIYNFQPQEIEAYQAKLVKLKEPPSKSPLGEDFKITAGYGYMQHPILKKRKFHRGIDLIAPSGTPVYATSDGTVVKAEEDAKGYGHHIILKHDSTYQTLYAHLSLIAVEEGQQIKKGELIGKVGNTGMSTGPHLHYEVIKNGKKVDPKPFIVP